MHVRAETEKTTFSCKNDCTLTKRTWRWTYSALRYFFQKNLKTGNIYMVKKKVFFGFFGTRHVAKRNCSGAQCQAEKDGENLAS